MNYASNVRKRQKTEVIQANYNFGSFAGSVGC